MRGLEVASRLMDEEILEGACLGSFRASELRGEILSKVVGAAFHVELPAIPIGREEPPSTPKAHTGLTYMAVGPTKLAFFTVKDWVFYRRVDQLLALHPRSEVTHMELHRGRVNVAFRDGTKYRFERLPLNLGKAKRIASIVGKP